jgi:hypothetical protein
VGREETPIEPETAPPIGATVFAARSAQKPTGESLERGEAAVVCEHTLFPDGRFGVGLRTPDGRVLRTLVAEAYAPNSQASLARVFRSDA